MRRIVYAVILVLTCFAPVKPLDIAELLPVEAVAVYTDGIQMVLETDTQNIGRGGTIEQALSDLKEKASAVIYLDTAEYLLVSEDAKFALEDLAKFLKPTVKVSDCDVRGRVKEASEYLRVHPKYKTLKDVLSEQKEISKNS